MKTTVQIISKFFGTIILAGTLSILNPAQAGNAGMTNPDTTYQTLASSQAISGKNITDPPVSLLSSEMMTDPNYWVNYLKSTVNPNEDDLPSTKSVIEEMEINPEYWIDSLKHIVTEE